MTSVRTTTGAEAHLTVDENFQLKISGAGQNSDSSILTSALRTATTQSSDQTNTGSRGVLIFLNITAASGTGGLTLRILGKDPVSGQYFYINAAPTTITATGQYGYVLGPGCMSYGGSLQQTTATILPRVWAVQIVHGDGSNYTYSVGASVVS